MNELERIAQQEKALKEKKKKLLAKEYEKLGKAFFKKSKAKTLPNAQNMLDHIPMFTSSDPSTEFPISQQDLAELQTFADELTWNEQGQYWRTNDIKNLTLFLAKFRGDK